MTTIMDSPDLLKKDPSAIKVKRLNKIPLAIVMGLVTLILLAAIYAIYQKKSSPREFSQDSVSSGSGGATMPELMQSGTQKARAGQNSFSSADTMTGSVPTPQQQLQLSEAEKARIEAYSNEIHRIQSVRLKSYEKALYASSGIEVKNDTSFAASTAPARIPEGGYRLVSNEIPGERQLLGSGSDEQRALNALDASTDPNMQGRKERFFNSSRTPSGYLRQRKMAPVSPFEIKRGSIIPAILVTGINSDLPGLIKGQVSQNVYDTATGSHLLIPQGTMVVGSYDSFIALGQERAMVVWNSLVFPDTSTLELEGMAGADQSGYAGFNDQVNHHYMKIFGSAILLSLVGAGYQMTQPTSKSEGISAREIVAAQLGQQLNQVSSELIRRNMRIQPTIEIRPGYKFNVMVSKDIILTPYVHR